MYSNTPLFWSTERKWLHLTHVRLHVTACFKGPSLHGFSIWHDYILMLVAFTNIYCIHISNLIFSTTDVAMETE